MPERLRLSRQRDWRKPQGAVVVSRPSRWGNPFTLDWARLGYPDLTDGEARAFVVAAFRSWLTDNNYAAPLSGLAERRTWILEHLHELRGKSLACWCPLPGDGQEDHCHARVLIDLAQAEGTTEATHDARNTFPQVTAP